MMDLQPSAGQTTPVARLEVTSKEWRLLPRSNRPEEAHERRIFNRSGARGWTFRRKYPDPAFA